MSFYYKETFPIVLVPHHWAPLWSGLKLFVKTDSQAAAAILNKGSNFCPVIMSWIHSLFWLKKYENFSLFIRHIQEQPAPWQIVFYPLMMCTTGQRPSMALHIPWIEWVWISHATIVSCSPWIQGICSNLYMKSPISGIKHMHFLPSPPTWVKCIHTYPFVDTMVTNLCQQ